MSNTELWFYVSNKLAFHPPEYDQLSNGHVVDPLPTLIRNTSMSIDHLPVHFLSTSNWPYGIKSVISCVHMRPSSVELEP